jgi:hypothetical protein
MKFTEIQVKEAIVFYILHNQYDLMFRLQPLLDQRKKYLETEDKVFHDDIKNDFEIAVKRELSSELSQQLDIDIESIMIAMEGFSVKEFLNE